MFLYVKKEKIYTPYVSKYNSNHEKQVNLSMIPNASRWRFLELKELAALLREIISKNNRRFYCWNFIHPFKTKSKLQPYKKVCKNKNFCNIIMLTEDTKLSEFNQYKKIW